MDKEEYLKLCAKVADGLASDEEVARYISATDRLSEHGIPMNDMDRYARSQAYIAIKEQLAQVNGQVPAPHSFRIPYGKIAASIVLFVFLAMGFHLFRIGGFHKREQRSDSTILPGRTAASLTLANGKEVLLENLEVGEKRDLGGVLLSRSQDGTFTYQVKDKNDTGEHTLQTGRGQQFQLCLFDGSKVWLNAGSTIRYFTGAPKDSKNRDLWLDGEAYFEIAKDPERPFIVHTKSQEVRVLGTHFNVQAYHGEEKELTTLLEGNVAISSGVSKITLFPGEQAVLQKDGLTKVKKDVTPIIAWKNGLFSFNEDNLKEIMNRIERWYDVEVVFQGADPTIHFGGEVSRSENIDDVLSRLELTGAVSFKKVGRRVFVRP